jgi:hypothetical protein
VFDLDRYGDINRYDFQTAYQFSPLGRTSISNVQADLSCCDN